VSPQRHSYPAALTREGDHAEKSAVVAVVVPIVVAVAAEAAALTRAFQLFPTLPRLLAVLPVAPDLLSESCLRLADALFTFVIPVACLRWRRTGSQQEASQ